MASSWPGAFSFLIRGFSSLGLALALGLGLIAFLPATFSFAQAFFRFSFGTAGLEPPSAGGQARTFLALFLLRR